MQWVEGCAKQPAGPRTIPIPKSYLAQMSMVLNVKNHTLERVVSVTENDPNPELEDCKLWWSEWSLLGSISDKMYE